MMMIKLLEMSTVAMELVVAVSNISNISITEQTVFFVNTEARLLCKSLETNCDMSEEH